MRHSRQEKFLQNFWHPEKSGQEKLEVIPEDFQEKIKNKKIILVGCGGVGSVLGQLLIRGGFMNLVLVDNDIVDETNLQRQLYREENIGEAKTNALKEELMSIDKNSKIKIFNTILDEYNIADICRNSQLIIDATDNFETRRAINEYCEEKEKDWLYNGAVRAEIMTCLFRGKDKLFNKVFPQNVANVSCCDVGVLASTTFTSASLAYNQILKYFLNTRNQKKLIKMNLWTNKIFEIKL